MNKVKILQVIPVFSEFFGGPVFDVQSISSRLSEKHDVTIYTTNAYDWNNDTKLREEQVNGCRVVYFPRFFKWPLLRELLLCKGMNKVLNDDMANFDIIHFHTWRQYMEVVTHNCATKYRVPYVHQSHGALGKTERKGRKLLYETIFGRKILRDASGAIALSDLEAQEYRLMGVRKNKISVIPNGIELSEYKDLPPKGTFKEKYGIKDKQRIILYLGRIHRTKGIDFLINTYSTLLRDQEYRNTLLVIAGPDEGGYLQEAKQLVASLRITDNVLFPGILLGREKIAAFVDASICAYLRPNEPFGRVSLEAAASGTPVIVCKDTPMSNIVRDGHLGFSVKYGDRIELINVIKDVLMNEALEKEKGICGRDYVFENFSWDTITDRLELLYNQII